MVDVGIKSRQKYEEALQAAADGTLAETNAVPLCHTCRIVKPLRSKHCTVAKRCVPMFDHYCPYINNTIGGGNYFWFIAFIFTGMLGVGTTFGVSLQYLAVHSYTSVLGWAMSLFWGMTTLMAIMMNRYHAYLIVANLTTNEDINKARYHYLRDDLNNFRNPFSRGCLGNMGELFGRGAAVRANPYVHSEEYQKFILTKDVELGEITDSGASTDGSEADDDDIKGRSLLPQGGHAHGQAHGHAH